MTTVTLLTIESEPSDATAQRLIRYALSALLGRKVEPSARDGRVFVRIDVDDPGEARGVLADALDDAAEAAAVTDWRRHLRIVG